MIDGKTWRDLGNRKIGKGKERLLLGQNGGSKEQQVSTVR